MAEEESTQPTVKKVPLVWIEPGAPIVANQAVVQYDGNLVYVTFGQSSPPLILGDTEEERRQQLDKINSIAVAPVIRLVMAPEHFRAVVEVFQRHVSIMDAIGNPKPQLT